jgi:hypothetical protein
MRWKHGKDEFHKEDNMKQIINGKRYDTASAVRIAGWDNGYGQGDFRWCSEELYKTKTGAYFIAGEGGAMSRYARPCGDMTGGGSGITPYTEEEAREWCEKHGLTDALETFFSASIEDA